MVYHPLIEEPNLSYVRVNSNSPGTGESIKCHITKNMSPSDPMVVNAGLLHPSMVDQPEPKPLPTCPLWLPSHLYAPGEKPTHIRDTWVVVEGLDKAEDKTVTVRQSSSATIRIKRSLEDPSATRFETEQPQVKKLKIEVHDAKVVALIERNKQLERKNAELEKKLKEKVEKLNLVSNILKNPAKLKILVSKLERMHDNTNNGEPNVADNGAISSSTSIR